MKNQDNQQQMSQQLDDEDAQMARENKAVRNIKCDICQYLRARGFVPGKGKGAGAWGADRKNVM